MIIPIVFAIWFGLAAKKAGKSVFLSGIGGALLAFVINTVIVNVGAIAFGPFTMDTYVPFRIISSIIALFLSVVAGRAMLGRPNPRRTA
ncbi:MAG: hypothetical protein ACI8QZ_002877 [Chlamydiales bacterium]|jgi:hypothetical protein